MVDVPPVTVIVPTRFARVDYIQEAFQSIRAQGVQLEILVGVDRDAVVPDGFAERFGVTICRGSENSQAAALNACIPRAQGEFVAFLEDDDKWLPEFLVTAASVKTPFVSSTQLEVDQDGVVLRINDYPTPSGWFVRRDALLRLGPFVPMIHLDNYMLGRVGEIGIERAHLIEATAPILKEHAECSRPFLLAIMNEGRPTPRIFRHSNPYPLVIRRVHSGSGMWQVRNDPTVRAQSAAEFDELVKRFGAVPW
jgi:glycosyltransferase involved in cell wall biosynthesis